jgi:hypothetical protein
MLARLIGANWPFGFARFWSGQTNQSPVYNACATARLPKSGTMEFFEVGIALNILSAYYLTQLVV